MFSGSFKASVKRDKVFTWCRFQNEFLNEIWKLIIILRSMVAFFHFISLTDIEGSGENINFWIVSGIC